MRAAVQVRRVRARQGRRDDRIRHFQEQPVDLFGRLHGGRRRALVRDHFEQRLERGIEDVPIVGAAGLLAGGPTPHQAEPLAVPESHVGQRAGDRPPVRQAHGETAGVERSNDPAQPFRLRSVALGESP